MPWISSRRPRTSLPFKHLKSIFWLSVNAASHDLAIGQASSQPRPGISHALIVSRVIPPLTHGNPVAKTLCKIKKLLKEDPAKYIKHVKKPKFVCRSCGRVANKRGLLCSPLKISSFEESAIV